MNKLPKPIKMTLQILVMIVITYLINMVMTIEQYKSVARIYVEPTILPTATPVITLIPTNTPKPTEIPIIQPADNRENVRQFILREFPNSPMLAEIDFIFDTLPNEKAIKLFAIAGTESGFGTSGYIATNCNNPFGYLYTGTSKRGCYSPKWDTLHNAIDRYITLESDGWLSSNTMQGYCGSECTYWNTNYNSFYLLFN